MDCLFCKIIAGDIPSTKVYEDEMVYAFRDIAPMAPTHILIVPKVHMASADEVTSENSAYVARIFEVIPKIAAAECLEKDTVSSPTAVRMAVSRSSTFTSTCWVARSCPRRWRKGDGIPDPLISRV